MNQGMEIKITKLEETDLKDFYWCEFETGSPQDFGRRTRIYIDGQKYVIQESKQLNEGSSWKIWRARVRKITQQTINNYDGINFLNIINIQRINQTQIEMTDSLATKMIYTLSSPEDCLKEFVLLKRIRKEANSKYGPHGLE